MAVSDVREHKVSDRTIVLHAHGTLDPAGAQTLAVALADAFARRIQHVILDMSDVESLSSAGIGVIFTNREVFRGGGGDLILCGLSDNIKFVLRELDLIEQMSISKDVQQALSSTES